MGRRAAAGRLPVQLLAARRDEHRSVQGYMFGSMRFEFDNRLTLEYHLGRADKKKEL